MALVGEMQIDHGGFESGVSEVALDEAEVATGFEQMGGVGMPEGRDGDASFGHAGAAFGLAEGALDTVSTHRLSGARALFLIASGGGQEPGLVTGGCPGGSEPRQGILRQGTNGPWRPDLGGHGPGDAGRQCRPLAKRGLREG